MLIEVKVPVLPESITEATLVAWHKKVGEAVKRDDESDRPSRPTRSMCSRITRAPDSGVLSEIRMPRWLDRNHRASKSSR